MPPQHAFALKTAISESWICAQSQECRPPASFQYGGQMWRSRRVSGGRCGQGMQDLQSFQSFREAHLGSSKSMPPLSSMPSSESARKMAADVAGGMPWMRSEKKVAVRGCGPTLISFTGTPSCAVAGRVWTQDSLVAAIVLQSLHQACTKYQETDTWINGHTWSTQYYVAPHFARHMLSGS